MVPMSWNKTPTCYQPNDIAVTLETAYKGFLFSTSSPTLVIFCLLHDSHCNKIEETSYFIGLVLISIFLVISDVEHLFMYLMDICISFLEKYLLKYFPHY